MDVKLGLSVFDKVSWLFRAKFRIFVCYIFQRAYFHVDLKRWSKKT